MSRSRTTARKAGAAFERAVADYLKEALCDDSIDRQVKTGAKDLGDIRGVKDAMGRPVVIECKEYAGRLHPATWIVEAHREAGNAGAAVGVVVAKRQRVQNPGDQWVLMTLEDLATILKGK